MSLYKETVSRWLDHQDSETWHHRALEALHAAEATQFTLKLLELFAHKHKRFVDTRLNVALGTLELENPLLVGAGWDKSGRAVEALYTLGFGGVEVGSVLAHPQFGNPKPRQFIIGPGVALNRMGFNSHGASVVSKNLERYKGSGIPIGISLGKNVDIPLKDAPEAYASVVLQLYEYADFFVINVSSPNTPGLRLLQDKRLLTDLVQAVQAELRQRGIKKDIYVKIAPELSHEDMSDVVQVIIDLGLAGIIAANTTNNPTIKAKYGDRWKSEPGGLSGNDTNYRKMVTEKIAHIYRETNGQMNIIGVGGINSTETALEKIRAGAKVVQIVTGIRGEGPALPGRINRGIVKYMEKEGIQNLTEIVGVDAKK